ncbi:MAG: helix-turn-helix domain-containing protein [Candidatus ainarchaeum sp.]|nr:helix-turn-helix domain-containing protein [Candidatus ainarchaeum sp.]
MPSKVLIDPDVDLVFNYYKHLFPNFSVHHALIYKFLWRVEPIGGEDIINQSGVSKATVYRILHDLCSSGLVEKTNFKPISYYAINPIKNYNSNLKQLLKKLEKGSNELEKIMDNSTSLSGELYLVKRDGGQQRLLLKQNRSLLNDSQQLLELKRVIDEQLKETDKTRIKGYVAYK